MSRIGKQTIKLPQHVNTIIENSVIYVKGPKGELSYIFPNSISIKQVDKGLQLLKTKQHATSGALYGLSRTIINNMVIGVSEGFSKVLEIQGIGYRSQMDGTSLILNVGYSHPIIIKPPNNIKLDVANSTQIIVSGINKEIVGQIAAKIRNVRPPEPYKGKGIRYLGEQVQRKVGKAGK